MTLAEEAEAELKGAKGDRAPYIHFSDEGTAICRIIERRLDAMSRRIKAAEKRIQEESA